MDKFLRKYLQFLYYILAFPFQLTWEPGLQIKLKLQRKSLHFVFWTLGWLTILTYSISCWLLFFHYIHSYLADKLYVNIVFHSQWAAVSFMCLAHLFPYIKEPEVVMQITNGCVHLINNLEEVHFGPGSLFKSKDIRSKLVNLFGFYSLFGFVPTILPIFVYFQKENWQIGSFPHKIILYAWPDTNYVLPYIIGVIVDLWECFVIWGAYLLSFHINLSFMHTFKTAISLILSKKLRRAKLLTPLKILQEEMLIYSKLRIITQVYNNVFGMLYVPSIKAIFSVMIVQSMFASIRLSGKAGFIVAFFSISCSCLGSFGTSLFIEFTAMVNQSSEGFGKYLTNCRREQGALGRRIIRSYVVVAVKTGNYYSIRKITVLTFLSFIFNMCGSALISVHF